MLCNVKRPRLLMTSLGQPSCKPWPESGHLLTEAEGCQLVLRQEMGNLVGILLIFVINQQESLSVGL